MAISGTQSFGSGTPLNPEEMNELRRICTLFSRSGWAPAVHHHLVFLGLPNIDVEDIARRIGNLTTESDFVEAAPYLMSASNILRELGAREDGMFVSLVPEDMRHRSSATVTSLMNLWHRQSAQANRSVSAISGLRT